MLELLTDQSESDRLFKIWTGALVNGSSFMDGGWVIEGSGVAFTNYGWGKPGTVENEVMLGVDPDFRNGIVKIVQPVTAQGDRGRHTAIAGDEGGRHFLLRHGRLQRNHLSPFIQDDFASLTGLKPVQVEVAGAKSTREWYVVADLGATARDIRDETADFTLACARARAAASQEAEPPDEKGYGLGLDEQGRTVKLERPGGSVEFLALQGFVWQALKELAGDDLKKPARNGFAVDGILESAKLLIEIKTGVASNFIYEAVGQLKLYPSLIGLNDGLSPTLLLPNQPMLKPVVAAALDAAGIKVYTYSTGTLGEKPRITFSSEFIYRWRLGTTS